LAASLADRAASELDTANEHRERPAALNPPAEAEAEAEADESAAQKPEEFPASPEMTDEDKEIPEKQ
jgi:hypothetical protein